MKKIIHWIGVLMAVFTFALPLMGQTYSDILLNGDFEQGLTFWTNRECTMTLVDTPVYSGRNAVLVTDRTKRWGGPAQNITDSLRAYGPGTYIISGFFRMQTGTDTAKIQIKLTVDGSKIYHQINAFVNSLHWTEVRDTLHITWDSSATLDAAEIYLQLKHDQSLNYYVDNISVIPDSVNPSGGGEDDTTGFEPDDPISPNDYVRMLGKGFDVSWSEFNSQIASYNEQMVKDIKAAGFSHVRLRTNKNVDNGLFNILDEQIKDCLKNDVIPIIAYQGHEAEDNPTEENRDAFIAWWRAMAEHYKDYSHKLAFDLLVEISGDLSDQPDLLNDWYERVVASIREVSPDRLIIISPVELSNPYKLPLLQIPSQANGYLLAEWHFYAAGPSKTNEKKLWTTGTPAEKKLITDKINAALSWQDSTGIPTWVGAWMPGNYNKGNDYTVPEQVRFASFMVRELGKSHIPWAVNAIHQFYDADANHWYNDRLPVVDVMVDPFRIVLYKEAGYGGQKLSLPVGKYDQSYLQQVGFLNQIGSIMIPMDFKVHAYSDDHFSGTDTVYTWTDSTLSDDQNPTQIASLTVEYDSTETSIEQEQGMNTVHTFRLEQNFPNPFNPSTTIRFSLPSAGMAKLIMYNVLGQKVRNLVQASLSAGTHRVTWDGCDDWGKPLPSGIYFFRLQSKNKSQIRKMILFR